jgi:hypothetical protein
MKSKWAEGVMPRFFAWVIRDALAISERPGGYARNHRRVRRHEEILWLRSNGFTRVVSLLGSPHNLHAYDELQMPWSHFPLAAATDPRAVLPELYRELDGWMRAGERVLVHQEALGDQLMGVVGGYLWWSRRVPGGPHAILALERLARRQMGPEGRGIVALVLELPRWESEHGG